MSIYTYLKNDHKKILKLLQRIEDEGPEESESRTDLFNELKEVLLIHEHAEEEAFYKPLKENSNLDEELDENEEEHEETENLLQQLTDPGLVGEDWYDVFLELKSEMEAHIEEEEDELFEKARGVFSTNDAQDLEDDMKNQSRHERENTNFKKRKSR
mgnify:CR=1 FL=1